MDNQDIALNIVMSGYQALCLVQKDDGCYFSADSFIEEMRAIQFTGSCSKRKSILANWIIRKNYDSNDCRSNKTIQKMWDKISQMFLLGSLSGIAVLGDGTREYLLVNLIVLSKFG